jgi:hypothetical protein
MTNPRPRRSGSVRFDPYFKLQVWRGDVGGAWVDIQRSFPGLQVAVDAAPLGRLIRVIRVTDDGSRDVVWTGERVV